MTATNSGIQYAVQIITKKACETPLKYGPLNLSELIRSTKLNPQKVKNSLLILVQPFAQESRGDGLRYMAVYDNILHCLRFAKFLVVMADELGDDCKQLLAGLFEHGRLTHQQLMDRANQKSKSNKSQVEDTVQERFFKIVTSRFVKRCPVAEPLLEDTPEQEGPKKLKTKSDKMLQVTETLEQHVLAAARPKPASMSAGIKACVENVRARHDDGAAIVLIAMLKAPRIVGNKVKTDSSVPMKLNAIYDEVIDSEVQASLSLFSGAPLVNGVYEDEDGDGDRTYSIDLKRIIEQLQNNEVDLIVLKRYGKDAYRIFRLLSSQSSAGQFFETDKVSEMALVDKKETPKILFKLWQDDYVQMEKLTLTAPKQSNFMVWKVRKSVVWEHVLDEMYHAAYNLVMRYDHEREENKEVTSTPKEKRTVELEKKANRFINLRKLMASSLVKLDDSRMIFHDF